MDPHQMIESTYDAVREAVHERRDRIEDALTDQLEYTAADMVEAYL